MQVIDWVVHIRLRISTGHKQGTGALGQHNCWVQVYNWVFKGLKVYNWVVMVGSSVMKLVVSPKLVPLSVL